MRQHDVFMFLFISLFPPFFFFLNLLQFLTKISGFVFGEFEGLALNVAKQTEMIQNANMQ